MGPSPDVYDHLRPTDASVPSGVYRVVGVDETQITLLRVADGDGTRRNTGDLVRIERSALESFEIAANPDGNRPLSARLRSALMLPRWVGQAYLDVVREHPLRGGVPALFFVVGALGGAFDLLPGFTGTLLVLAGGLGFLRVVRSGS